MSPSKDFANFVQHYFSEINNCLNYLLFQEMKEIIEIRNEKESQIDSSENQGEFLLPQGFNSGENNFINGSTFANLCVFFGFAVFAVVVNYVVKAVASEDDL